MINCERIRWLYDIASEDVVRLSVGGISMNAQSIFFIVFAYASIAVFIAGFLARIWKYAITPSPLKIALTPAPVTTAGVFYRMFQEVVLFKSLFYSNKIIWLAGYAMHLALVLVLIKHTRFFYNGTPAVINYITTYELYIGFIFLVPLVFLFVLRIVVDRTFYISIMTDYIILALLILIAMTGVIAKYYVRTNIIAVKSFIMGLVNFRPEAIPGDIVFIVHFTLVMFLLVYFPFSKLMHAGGIFFSPTRNQIDNPREVRHETAWTAKG
jgi:nitrate reductase gamma subunit